MRKIIVTQFVTLDGVVQAPGGKTEDTSGGFLHGGWSVNYWDDLMGKVMEEFMILPFELLLGHKTYDIFASYWPEAKEDKNIADLFNQTKKYVVSHEAFLPKWQNSINISNDVVAEIRKLKNDAAPDLWVHGSSNLIQTLLKEKLVDRIHIWTFPMTVGLGKRLFAEGTQPESCKLVKSLTSNTGVIIASYDFIGSLDTKSN